MMIDAQTVYVDDSGSDTKSRVAAAAFCVSTVERWQELLGKWNKIASDAGFELKDFHMTEFVACRRGELCRQCLAGKTSAVEHPWQTWSETKRKSVLTRMAKGIVKYVEYGVGHAFTKEDYDQYVRKSPARLVTPELVGDEYFTYAVQRCGGAFAEWRAAQGRLVPLKFVFDTASKKEKKEIANVFFAAINRELRDENGILKKGIEECFNPELGVSYESRKQTHQLLTADMLAWTVATIRARELFMSGRAVELFWVARIFVPTKHIRLGYTLKDTLAQWEKDRLNEAAKSQSGVSELRPNDAGTSESAAQ